MQASSTHEINCLSGSELQDLEAVVLWDPANWVELIIRSSEHPRLRISGNETMIQRYRCWRSGNTLYLKLDGNLLDRVVDAFTTSLTRKEIHIELMVDSLDRVRATGIVEVDLAGWSGIEPEIHLFGPTALWGGMLREMKP